MEKMKHVMDISDFLYRMRIKEDPIGVICRESNLCTFDGRSISCFVDDSDLF